MVEYIGVSNLSVVTMIHLPLGAVSRQFSTRVKTESKVLSLMQSFRNDVQVDDNLKQEVRLEVDSNINALPRAQLAELLVTSGYYGVLEQGQYDKILAQLSRIEPIKEDKPSVTTNTKTFELMVRCGLVPSCSYADFSPYSKRFLLRTRGKSIGPSPSQPVSTFRTQLRELLEEVASDYQKDVVVGPYYFDFIRLKESGVTFKPSPFVPDLKLLMKKYICVNVVEGSDISATGTLKPSARIRSSILSTLTAKAVSVFHSDWDQLGEDNLKAKKIYLGSLLGVSQVN